MLQGGLIFIVAMTYIGLLFAIAHYGDKYADKWRASRLKPTIYALSMAVYCTSWTFFGSVGSAATGGSVLRVRSGRLLAQVSASLRE